MWRIVLTYKKMVDSYEEVYWQILAERMTQNKKVMHFGDFKHKHQIQKC